MRNRRLLQDRAIGNRRLDAAEPHDRRVEIVERLALGDDSRDFRPDAERLDALVNGEQPPSRLDAGHDRVLVDRPQAAKVDHLGLDPLLGQDVRRFQRAMDHDRGGDDGEIAAFTPDDRPVERRLVIALGRCAFHFVEQLVLEHDHRIGVLDRREQHALDVFRRRRLDHLQARDMGVPGFDALAVLRGAA